MMVLRRAVVVLTVGFLAACGSSAAPFIAIPTPAPTPTPTPSPSVAALSAAPSTVDVNGLGPAFAQTVTVSELGYGGAFRETDTCAAIATIRSSTATGPSAAFLATGLATGSCSAIFTDAMLQQAHVSITVSVSSVVINVRSGGR